MIRDWLSAAEKLALQEATFYSGARKILRGRQLHFGDLDNDIRVEDAGYTKSKLTLLTKLYLEPESHAVALQLWQRRISQGKYGSVGFSTYNHLIKNDPEKKGKRASVMGPCIQSVCLTLSDKGDVEVDVFYRTTEFYKKFPADLVLLRDVLLAPFGIKTELITMHFANITLHPQYYVTIIPHQRDPIRSLERIREAQPFFFNWVIKWTARYLCEEHFRGIQKHAQSMRVKMDADKRVTGNRRDELESYLRKHHPGYRNEYVDPDGEDE